MLVRQHVFSCGLCAGQRLEQIGNVHTLMQDVPELTLCSWVVDKSADPGLEPSKGDTTCHYGPISDTPPPLLIMT